jgi:hypothetical protein
MFRAHVEFVIAHPGVPRFIFHELQQPADSAAKLEVRAVLQGYRKLLLGQLAESVDRAALVSPDLDPEAAATSFIGLIQGLVMQSMLTGRPAAMRQQAGRLVFALYRRGLGEAHESSHHRHRAGSRWAGWASCCWRRMAFVVMRSGPLAPTRVTVVQAAEGRLTPRCSASARSRRGAAT